ncbi:MAG: hypothetical protein DRJ09_04810 [Bacteroidetes bacterium]|nr:MAG: hypothetical protein DRJ09_04810 [Bacteroidota bacterium]
MKVLSKLLFLSVILFVSCSSTENKLTGVWKVQNVKTDFNENQTTPQMVQQVAEIQKHTHFKIKNDSVMVIISNNKTYEAVWTFDKNTKVISYHFKGDTDTHKLGTYVDPNIVTKSKTQLGIITTTYAKE